MTWHSERTQHACGGLLLSASLFLTSGCGENAKQSPTASGSGGSASAGAGTQGSGGDLPVGGGSGAAEGGAAGEAGGAAGGAAGEAGAAAGADAGGMGGEPLNAVTCGSDNCIVGTGICCRNRDNDSHECVAESACPTADDTAILTCDSGVSAYQCCLYLNYADMTRVYLTYLVEGACLDGTEIRLCDPAASECANCRPFEFDDWLPAGYYACQ